MAGASFKVEVDDTAAQAAFQRLIQVGLNMKPLWTEIGSALEDSSRRRFETERAPDGQAWEPISEPWRKTKEKKGFLTGILKMRGDLANSIRFEASGDYVEIIAGPTEYAAIHQFGGEAGRNRATTIPARPYLGLSDEDREEIADAASDALDRAAKGG